MSTRRRSESHTSGKLPTKPEYASNPYILRWWIPEYDEIIVRLIEKYQWAWYWEFTEAATKIIPSETLEAWKSEDPICSVYAWYNVLMYFAASRAEAIGLTGQIRKPKWKTCPVCKQEFVESSLHLKFIKILGADQLDFCEPCLSVVVWPVAGSDTQSKEQVLEYLRDLADTLQRIPPQAFGSRPEDLAGLTFEERLAVLEVMRRRPSVPHVKSLFGSWLKALIAAELLEDGARRTSRGTQCVAKDGHICLSLGEKTIDDFLYSLGIPHQKEPPYPEGNFRADFAVNGTLIEYFGLRGDPDYDTKTKLKQRMCRKHGIKLISLYPSDLASTKRLKAKLLGGLALR